MAIWEFEGKKPKIGDGTYIAESADVIGDVTIGENCYIGPGARVRGDYGTIHIGNGCSIQENVVIHARPNDKTLVGNYVTLGHGCILHNCTINDYAVVGMGAIISDYVVIETWGIVGEGTVVPNGKTIEEGMIVVGNPAKPIGNIHDEKRHHVKDELLRFKEKYQEMAKRHLEPGAIKRID